MTKSWSLKVKPLSLVRRSRRSLAVKALVSPPTSTSSLCPPHYRFLLTITNFWSPVFHDCSFPPSQPEGCFDSRRRSDACRAMITAGSVTLDLLVPRPCRTDPRYNPPPVRSRQGSRYHRAKTFSAWTLRFTESWDLVWITTIHKRRSSGLISSGTVVIFSLSSPFAPSLTDYH